MEVRALLDLGDVAKASRKLDDLAGGWAGAGVWCGSRRWRSCSPAITSRPSSISTRCWTPSPASWRLLALAATAELAGTSEELPFTKRCGTPTTASSRQASGPVAQSVEGDRSGAVTTLDEVPIGSRHFTTARLDQRGDAAVRAVRARADRAADPRCGLPGRGASRYRATSSADPRTGARDSDGLITDNKAGPSPILGFPFTDHGLRRASRRRYAAWPGGHQPGAPLRAGRPGQRGAAAHDILSVPTREGATHVPHPARTVNGASSRTCDGSAVQDAPFVGTEARARWGAISCAVTRFHPKPAR